MEAIFCKRPAKGSVREQRGVVEKKVIAGIGERGAGIERPVQARMGTGEVPAFDNQVAGAYEIRLGGKDLCVQQSDQHEGLDGRAWVCADAGGRTGKQLARVRVGKQRDGGELQQHGLYRFYGEGKRHAPGFEASLQVSAECLSGVRRDGAGVRSGCLFGQR